ncbi:DNA (cytosine-5)-methyltransferase CMT2-like [Coffea eugenioides]|uniref:DNA (cytosine-5)-methyltransferase CMT2-like n=1 Tax=Coffea eugenioides TaxID=49369 RepID=UPI000F60B7D5|nr:DNA (cytosine-5)-methyltransferase CMT2-like [Coffea eugenioides]
MATGKQPKDCNQLTSIIRRKSPRLLSSSRASSTPEAKPILNKKKKSRAASVNSEKSIVLSMHLENEEAEAIPLQIYDPNLEVKCLRRSPRYTTNKYRSSSESKLLALPSSASTTPEIQRRSSPRFLSKGKSANLTEMGGGFFGGSKKRLRFEENRSALHGSANGSGSKKVKVDFERLRKSPRSNKSLDEDGNGNLNRGFLALPKPGSSGKSDLRKCKLSGKSLRKSPRLNPDMCGELLALPEPGSSVEKLVSHEKRLRNRIITMHVGKEKEKAQKSGSERMDSAKGNESSNVSEKLLRSRKIRFKLPEASPKSELKAGSFGGSDKNNVSQKRLRSRKIEFKLTQISPNSDLAESSSGGSDFGDMGKKRLRNNGIEFELPEALENNNSNDEDVDVSDDSEKIETELVDVSAVENCEVAVLSEKFLRSRKIAYQIVGNEKVQEKSKKRGITRNKEPPVENKILQKKEREQKSVAFFVGEPIPEEDARERWRWRYDLKSHRSKNKGWILNAGEEDETILNVGFHYAQANVDGCVLSIGDCAYIKGEGRKKHIGRILEFFRTTQGEDYFRVQWYFRVEDTVIKEAATFHDEKRIFYSTMMNDNLLDCILSKVHVAEIPLAVGLEPDTIPPADFYYDMEYSVEYSTFHNLQTDNSYKIDDSHSLQPVEGFHAPITATHLEVFSGSGPLKSELALLDLYSGCGGMSTGLGIGAKVSSIDVVTRWAVDLEKSACDSLKLNHPETQVRNESAEDFLELLKRWKQLCESYIFNDLKNPPEDGTDNQIEGESNETSKLANEDPDGEYEVSCLVDICYGDPNETGKHGLHFKVRWKGYGPDEDTWEPFEGLSNCQERIQDFVRNGLRSKILPLPGHVDVICGGPPCQGISGYNRYRNVEDPLTDERNQQIVVFMDIVEFLKPKFVLMENVVDILRLDGASLGRYALSRLVHMKYQARLGTIAAGCYGLPQFRLRVFIWGALPSERLPPFPLPTHDVVVRYWPPPEFERNTVAYDEGQPRKLEEAVFLQDAISDLPAVANHESREKMAYDKPPGTDFQRYIRLSKEEMMGSTPIQVTEAKEQMLYDHRPYRLNEDNYLRVCQIPHRKGANFRDLPGVIVGDDNVVHRDTTKDTFVLPSGGPIVPDCVFTFEKGKSKRPFARLWWDETVPTVLTFPHHRSQAILHPEQDRVLTVRECARLQGFPDFYRFCGTIKERYCQIGNAVAIPVGKALGYTLGMTFQNLCGDEPLLTLPSNFSFLQPLKDEIVVLRN